VEGQTKLHFLNLAYGVKVEDSVSRKMLL
jgi:hypothetical protein